MFYHIYIKFIIEMIFFNLKIATENFSATHFLRMRKLVLVKNNGVCEFKRTLADVTDDLCVWRVLIKIRLK